MQQRLPCDASPPALEARYRWATEQRLRLIGHLSADQLQRLYGLYKRVLLGENVGERPPEHHRVAFAKWTAWTQASSLPREDAMREYIAHVEAQDAQLQEPQPALDPLTRHTPTTAQPLTNARYDVPGHPYPQLEGWRNHATELYLEAFGVEHHAARCAAMLAPYERSHMARLELEQYTERLAQFFFNQAEFALPKDSYIVAEGTLTIDERAPTILGPSLAPGRVLPLQLKHKNVTRGNSEFGRYQDDTSATVYRGSLKMELEGGQVFDLPMLTSRIFYPNIPSFMGFTLARDSLLSMYRDGDPVWYVLATEARRVRASSYASVVYHAPIPRFLRGEDGRAYMARFRMTPAGLEREEGLLTREQQVRIMREIDLREPGEPRYYLADEYRERLHRAPVAYELEVLLSPPLDEVDDLDRMANPAFVWDESVCRAHPLGRVEVQAEVTHVEQGAQLRFNPSNMPDNFFTPTPAGLRDPSAHNWVRRKMYACSLASTRAPLRASEDADTPYLLIWKLSEPPTRSLPVTLRLVGEHAGVAEIVIEDLCEAVAVDGDHYIKIETSALGEIAWVEMTLPPGASGALASLHVVHHRGVTQFAWGRALVEGTHVLFDARGTLPQHAPPALRAALDAELGARRLGYVWSRPQEGLPAYMDFGDLGAVPAWDQCMLRNQLCASTHTLEAMRREEDAERRFRTFSEVERMLERRYPNNLPPDEVFETWTTDLAFTEQFLAGSHPNFLRRADAIPASIPTEELARLRGGEAGLQAAIDAGDIFIADYAFLSGIRDDLPGAIVMFERHRRRLRPRLIQLELQGPLFTPDDGPIDWLAAKMWARLTDTNLCGMATHLLYSHQVMAAFHTALQRNLSPPHPLHQIMLPHLRNVFAAAMIGQEVLLSPGGFFDKITTMRQGAHEVGRRAWQTWSLRQRLDLPADLVARGVDDPEVLPHYPYRDDGLLIWEALRAFVSDVVGAFYASDEDVVADVEVQSFLREVVDEGLPGCDLERSVETRGRLTQLVTGVIFMSSAGHAAINSQMFKQHAFLPNAPWRLDGEPPRERGVLRAEDLVAWLPDRLTAERTMDMMAVLGLREVPGFFKTDEPNLGEDPLHSSHPDVRAAYARLQDTLDQTDAIIEERNRGRRQPYDAFLRENVTASASW